MIKEFREFIARGNALDLAVGVIIGAAFGKIVASLVEDILMPPIGLLLGKVDFSNLYVNLSGGSVRPDSLAEAKRIGLATLNYGVFVNNIINFLIVGFAIFLVVRSMNRLRRKQEPASVTTRECPYCISAIPIEATRCPQCTSELKAGPVA